MIRDHSVLLAKTFADSDAVIAIIQKRISNMIIESDQIWSLVEDINVHAKAVENIENKVCIL